MFFNELTLLRFLAIALITNSHIDHLYPIKYIGTGGSLGNSIFFFISAIGLTWSLNRKPLSFFEWYKKRFFRIYPLMFFVVTLYILSGFFDITNIKDIFRLYLFPKEFWFLPAILIFYVPIYFIIRNFSKKIIFYVVGILCFLYIMGYIFLIDKTVWSIENNVPFKSIFYFLVMILGVYVANNYDKFLPDKRSIFCLLFLTFVFFLLKAIMLFKPVVYKIQFVLHLITLLWLLALLKVVRIEKFIKFLQSKFILKWVVSLGASLTLEIYLLQSYFYNLKIVTLLPFPINIFLFTIFLTIASYILHIVYYRVITNKLLKLDFKI